MTKATCLTLLLLLAAASGSVIKNTVVESESRHGFNHEGEQEPSMMMTTAIIRNCGCLMLTGDAARGRDVVGRRYLPRSSPAASRDVICSVFCDHLSATHFATGADQCLCFNRPAAVIDCEEVELTGSPAADVAQLKCVDRPRPPAPNPTRRNTVSGSVLGFLQRNFPTAATGNDYKGLENDQAEFEDEITRRSRHTADYGNRRQIYTVPITTSASAKDDTAATSTKTSFGPSKSVGLAATLILLAFVCIFTMGLKTWYHTRRKEQKESDVNNKPVSGQQVKKDIDWEKIMSY